MRSVEIDETGGGTLEAWLEGLSDASEVAELCSVLRVAAGGGSRTILDENVAGNVASYFSAWERTDAELSRLATDRELRRQVASIAHILAVSEPVIGSGKERWFGRRWVGVAALLAASVAGILIAPHFLDRIDGDSEHRSATITVADVHVLGPEGPLAAPPRIEWKPVLGADLYQVEVTDARGRIVFLGTTEDRVLQVPAEVLEDSVPYFYRVRARIESARWVASDFQEFVIR